MADSTQAWWQQPELQGARSLVLSSLAFSLMTVCVKQLGGRLPVSEIVLVRSLVSIALTTGAMAIAGVSPLGRNKPLLLTRGVCGSIALLCFFEAITQLPLASATVLQTPTPPSPPPPPGFCWGNGCGAASVLRFCWAGSVWCA